MNNFLAYSLKFGTIIDFMLFRETDDFGCSKAIGYLDVVMKHLINLRIQSNMKHGKDRSLEFLHGYGRMLHNHNFA